MAEPKLKFAHVCDYAFNGENGKLCVIGIFKNITVQNSEQPHPQMFIVTNIAVDTGRDYKQIIKLVKEEKPDENIIKPIEISVGFGKESGQSSVEFGFIGQLNNIKFKESGKYLVKIYIDDVLLGEIPISIVVNNLKLIQR
jgi:hypothetical protein